jgi:hypothetical protein
MVHSTKWIAASFAALLFPFVLHAVGLRIRQLAEFPGYSVMFLAGAGLVVVLCRTDTVHSSWVRSAISLERKWTQGLISRLLLAPPARRPGDHWLGKGNWVILASPYFLPIASILMWMASGLLLPASLRSFVIGIGVAYHVASVVIQWRFGTRESRRLGIWFGILFLIPANLMVIGAGYGFALGGFGGLFQFFKDVFQPLWSGPHAFLGFMSSSPSLTQSLL